MSSIQSISPDFLKLLRVDLDAALAQIGQKHGIALKAGQCSYTADNFKMPIEGATIGANGSINTREAEAFRMSARLHGFAPEDLGAVIAVGGVQYRIIGLSTRSTLKPVILTRVSDNVQFSATIQSVRSALGRL